MLRKNVASQYIYFALINATTGAALTGATVTARRIIDGVAAAATGSVTEPNSDGFYQLALSQADTNGNDIGYFFTATNAVPVGYTVVTTALDPTSTAFGLLIAKTTNITGFNDITAAAAATGIWQDTTAGDFTVAASIGKSVMNGVALGTGLTINAYTGDTPQTGDTYALANGVTGFTAIDTVVDAVKVQTDKLAFTVANQVDANIQSVNDVTVLGDGAGTPWGP